MGVRQAKLNKQAATLNVLARKFPDTLMRLTQLAAETIREIPFATLNGWISHYQQTWRRIKEYWKIFAY